MSSTELGLLLSLALLCMPSAQASDTSGPFDGPDGRVPEIVVAPPEKSVLTKNGRVAGIAGLEDRLDLLEVKVAELDATRITADEARTIAREEIAKVQLAFKTSSGQVVTRNVSVGVDYRGGFDVPPGATLSGYTDPNTGFYVDLTSQSPQQVIVRQQPVLVHSVGSVQVRTTSSGRGGIEVTAGPVRRLLLGRARARIAASGNCYINAAGQRVCN